MASSIVRRIESAQRLTGLFDALSANLSASDLQSLLLEVFRERAEFLSAPGFLSQAARGGLLATSEVDPRIFHKFDGCAFEAASDFEAVDLSPVCPLGASFVLGGTSQNNVLTAIRNVEVLGDSTIALAILSALRRRASGRRPLTKFCASHRVIRLQPFEAPGLTPHFRLLALTSAGHDTGSFQFEFAALREHIEAYLRLFDRLNQEGFSLKRTLIEFSDMTVVEAILNEHGVGREEIREAVRAHWEGGSTRFLSERGISLPEDVRNPGGDSLKALELQVVEPLRAAHPDTEFRINLSRLEGLGYYRNFTLRISPEAPDRVRYPVGDGGFTDWTARLLSNQKERLLISGVGSEFVCKKYRV